MAATLADALLLMHTAGERFASVRMTVRRWHDRELLLRAWRRDEEHGASTLIEVSLSGDPGEPPPPERTQRTRVWWLPPGHARLENEPGNDGPRIEVAAGPRWWTWDPDWGASSNETEPDLRSEGQEGPFPELLQPDLLPSALHLELIGSGLHAGRRAIALRGRPRRLEGVFAMLMPLTRGADSHDLMVDAERGVVLRVASEIDGRRFSLVEVEEIAFDEAFPPETFTLELPPGEEFGHPLIGLVEDVTLDEAARRAPFTLLAPPLIPRGADVAVHYIEAIERPPSPARVGIEYHVERGGFSFDLGQMAVEDAVEHGLVAAGEVVERDGRSLRVRDVDGERQLELEHLGTHVVMTSQTMPRDVLVELMLSLEPAPTEPPELVAP